MLRELLAYLITTIANDGKDGGSGAGGLFTFSGGGGLDLFFDIVVFSFF